MIADQRLIPLFFLFCLGALASGIVFMSFFLEYAFSGHNYRRKEVWMEITGGVAFLFVIAALSLCK